MDDTSVNSCGCSVCSREREKGRDLPTMLFVVRRWLVFGAIKSAMKGETDNEASR